jgi:hypothetical protein
MDGGENWGTGTRGEVSNSRYLKTAQRRIRVNLSNRFEI